MKYFCVALAAIAGGFLLGSAALAGEDDGESLTVHNNTGHHVVVFLLQSAGDDLDPDDGVQVASIGNGESAVAHAPSCHFEILLVDQDDVWHASMHDCHSTDLTFTANTGHSHRTSH
ncbi:MAG TPA: hypothetical protein VKS60_03145 [Stellaceae bacterium]|nr:hypothetical protein [Stellaceae bacterium]